MNLSRIRILAILMVACIAIGMAQVTLKDQAEVDLVKAIQAEKDPAKMLQLLDQWSKAYPDSALKDTRPGAYLSVYQQLKKPRETMNTALDILKTNPNDFPALYAVLTTIYQLAQGNNPPPAADMENAEKVANHVVTDANTIFADTNKPPAFQPAQWAPLKTAIPPYAQRTITWMDVMRKDNARIEADAAKTLQMNPNDAQAAQWLGQALLAQQQADPKKTPLALFYYARAASITGQGALDAASQTSIKNFLMKAYNTYHGSNEGLDQLLATAKTNPMPPAGFDIKDINKVNEEKAAEQAKLDAANPVGTFMRTTRELLTGSNGASVWEQNYKEAALPGTAVPGGKLKGKIVSMKPENRPKEIVLAVEKADTPDVILKFEEPLPGKMDAGAELEFSGKLVAYTPSPFMLTFEVEKDDLKGWEGKNTTAPKSKAGAGKAKAKAK
jgi:hypothetical protein